MIKIRFRFAAFLLSVIIALPVCAYDYPLSSNAIRDAYFLAVRRGGLSRDLLAGYSHTIADLKQGTCASEVRVETPFLQVADYASKAVNYSSQDAVKDFYGKPMVFRMYLNICYAIKAPPPNSLRVKLFQDKKVLVPLSDKREPYAEPADEGSYLPPNGEKIELEFEPAELNSSTLTIQIDTPDGQHTKIGFDLQTIR